MPELLIEVEAQNGAPAQTRQVIHERFHGEIAEGLLRDLLVVISELVTVSVLRRPRGSAIQVFISVGEGGLIQGKVGSEGDPGGAIPAIEADRGLGAQIISALVDRWAVDEETIWFELSERH